MMSLADECGYSLERTYRDSEPFQMWGSELYRRDVPLVSGTATDHFSSGELRAFGIRAKDLNERSDGDQAAYFLRLKSIPMAGAVA